MLGFNNSLDDMRVKGELWKYVSSNFAVAKMEFLGMENFTNNSTLNGR